MPNILDDNTVIPAYLGVRDRGNAAGADEQLNDNVLRIGEVKKVIYPDDDLSYGKRTVEYEVEVQHRVGNNIYNTTTYRGVTVNTVFGGVADRFHATYRADTTESENEDENKGSGTGSKVLLLCLNGDQQKAIILGGVEDPNRTGVENKDFGHNLFFEFNGSVVTIGADGQFELTFKGATDGKGAVKEDFKDSKGATFRITEKGVMSMFTIDSNGDDQTKITWDHVNNQLDLFSSKDLNIHADGETDILSSKKLTITVSQDEMDVLVRDNLNISTAGVKVGKADQAWVRGTKYREDQQQMNNKIKSAAQQLQLLLQTAATQMNIAAGLNATPIYGGAASQTNWQAAATAMRQAASAAGDIGSAIASFESGSSNFLSKDHFGD